MNMQSAPQASLVYTLHWFSREASVNNSNGDEDSSSLELSVVITLAMLIDIITQFKLINAIFNISPD